MSYIITTITLAFYDTKAAAIFIGATIVAKTIQWVTDEIERKF